MLKPLIQEIADFLTKVILEISVLFLSIFYSDVSTTPTWILTISNQEVIQIIYGCTGLIQLFQITFILIFYPIKWSQKVYLYPLSIIIILLATIIHFIILVPIAYHYSDYFSLFHDYTSRILFFGIVFLTWLVWEKVRVEGRNTSNAQLSTSFPYNKYKGTTLQLTYSNKKKVMRFSILGACFVIIPFISLIGSILKSNIEWLNNIFYFDKILYYLIYTILGFLALWACFPIVKTISNLLYVIILSGFLGIIMGVLNQHILFSDSSNTSLDIFVNLLGIICGALLFYFHLIYKYTNYFKPERLHT